MNKKGPSLIEYIKQLSGWTTGAIAYLTMLAGFIIGLRDDPGLMTIIILITSSGALLIASYRIINEKTPPLFIGGKEQPKHPKLRIAGYASFVIIPLANLLFFTSAMGREIIFDALKNSPTQQIGYDSPTAGPTQTQHDPATQAPLNSSETKTAVSRSLTSTPTPLDLVDVDYKRIGPCGIFALPENPDLIKDPFSAAEKYYSNKTNENFWDSFENFSDSGNVFVIKISNLQPAGTPWIEVTNSIKLEIDSYAPLKHLDVAVFSWGGGFSGRYIGHGCGGGNVEYEFPTIFLNRQDSIVISKNKEFDYFSLEPGEFLQFATDTVCNAAGLYQYHFVTTVSYGNQEREITSEPFVAYCPESYTEWWFHDVVKSGDEYEVHTVSNVGTYAANTSWSYFLETPGWTETKPWKPCPSAPESLIFPDPNSIRSIINPEEDSLVNVRSSPSILAAVVEKLSPGFSNIRLVDGPACADNMIWWKVELHVFGNENKPIVSGWIAEGDETEKWLIVQRKIPNTFHVTPQP